MKTRTETAKKANDVNEKIDDAQEFLSAASFFLHYSGFLSNKLKVWRRNHPPIRRSHSFPRNAAAHTSSTG